MSEQSLNQNDKSLCAAAQVDDSTQGKEVSEKDLAQINALNAKHNPTNVGKKAAVIFQDDEEDLRKEKQELKTSANALRQANNMKQDNKN